MAGHWRATSRKPGDTLGLLMNVHTALIPGFLQAVPDSPEGLPREDDEQGSSCPTSCKPAQQGRQPARGRSQSGHDGSPLIQSGQPNQATRCCICPLRCSAVMPPCLATPGCDLPELPRVGLAQHLIPRGYKELGSSLCSCPSAPHAFALLLTPHIHGRDGGTHNCA